MVRARIVVVVDRDTATAAIQRGAATEAAGEIHYVDRMDLARALTEMASGVRERTGVRRADIVLGPGVLQRRLLTDLPSVRPGILRELVQQQQKRFFRRNGKPLVTDARWERSAEGTGRHVVAVAADEGTVEAVIAGLAEAGVVVERVTDEERRFRLLPAGVVSIQHQRSWKHNRVLLSLAAALWIGVGVAHWVRLRVAERTLDAQLSQLAPAAASVRLARRKLVDAEQLVAAVDAADSTRPDMRLRLARVLQSVPDSAYLSSLTLDLTGTASVSGVAREAAAVVVALEEKAGLSSVHLEGAPLIDGTGGRRWERFSAQAGTQPAAASR